MEVFLKLTILERIVVSRFLPTKADYELLKTSEDFKPSIVFDEEESRKYDISGKTDENGRQMVTFNKDSAEGYVKDIKFPPTISAYISKTLKELSEKGEITAELIPIYEKFVL